jgi:hypothetical protein
VSSNPENSPQTSSRHTLVMGGSTRGLLKEFLRTLLMEISWEAAALASVVQVCQDPHQFLHHHPQSPVDEWHRGVRDEAIHMPRITNQ